MIVTETYATREDGTVLIRTYSDAGMMIEQDGTGALYSEAIDPQDLGRTYTETSTPIETSESDAEQIVSILLGEEQ